MKNNLLSKIMALLLMMPAMLFSQITHNGSGIVYVDQEIGSSGNGSSWQDAVKDLADALKAAENSASGIEQIWVAAGNYTPAYRLGNGNQDRDKTFLLPAGVKIYGGFAGGEANLDQRDFEKNKVVLSGVIGNTGNEADSVYHVVVAVGDMNNAVLDGVTITGGKAAFSGLVSVNSQSIHRYSGGGMYLHHVDKMLFSNLTVAGNIVPSQGGGIFITNSDVAMQNIRVEDNTAETGGGIYSAGINLTITNAAISGNHSTNNGGGIVCQAYYNQGDLTLTNVLLADNTAAREGGGIYISGSDCKIINSTITGNYAANNGGGMYNTKSAGYTTEISNSIIWGNSSAVQGANIYRTNNDITTFSRSLIQGCFNSSGVWQSNIGTDGGNNMAIDPLFTDADAGDYTLLRYSPAVNAGDNAFVPPTVITDLAGNSRIYNNGKVDLGAYEFQGEAAGPDSNGILYLSESGSGDMTGKDWNNCLPELSAALTLSGKNTDIKEIWLQAGTYKALFPPQGYSGDKNRTFLLPAGIKIYGGFAGGETGINERILSSNETVLSGVVGITGTAADSVLHVVSATGNMNGAILDGVTITGGNASGTSGSGYGGGIYLTDVTDMTFSNVTVKGNTALGQGGGIYLTGSQVSMHDIRVENNHAGKPGSYEGYGGGIFSKNSSPQIDNITVKGNTSRSGGGMRFDGGSPAITNAIITDNISQGSGGGIAISNNNAFTLTNALIANNQAGENSFGGAIYTFSGVHFDITNVTISGNTAPRYGGIYNLSPTAASKIKNSIIWGNGSDVNIYSQANFAEVEVMHSLIQGCYGTNNTWNTRVGTDKGNNIDIDPLFTDAGADDYSLSAFSPAVNAGDNALVPAAVTADLDGKDRIYGGTVDMGAYELQSQPAGPNAAGVLFVSEGGDGEMLGDSWENAFSGLGEALNFTHSNSEVKQIWIKAGTYAPVYFAGNGTTDRDKAFVLPANVKIYGGFAGGETNLDQRDFETNKVILSGVIGNSGTDADSVYHVVIAAAPNNSSLGDACLDGVTVTGGRANGSGNITVNSRSITKNAGGGIYMFGANDINLSNVVLEGNNVTTLGGGMFLNSSNPNMKSIIVRQNKAEQGGGGIYMVTSSPTMDSLQITGNIYGRATGSLYGGGIYINNTSAPEISNILIADNKVVENSTASTSGGGIYIYNSSPVITNGIVRNNTATNQGGGIYISGANSNPVITNALLTGNSGNYGGAIYASSGKFELTNATITGNTASYGSAIYYYTLIAGSTVRNSIIWENGSTPSRSIYKSSNNSIGFSYSLIQAWQASMGEDDGNLITANPMFTDAVAGKYYLSVYSPAIDKGNDSYISTLTDLDGNPRKYGNAVDMGAFELQTDPAGPDSDGVLFVSENGDGEKLGTGWADAFPGLAKALEFAKVNPSVKQLWVKEGTYFPETDHGNYGDTDRDKSFFLQKDLAVYGGFEGTETTIDDRVIGNHKTILSGDLNRDGEWDDNDAWNVITASGDMGTAILDGVTISGGNANSNTSNYTSRGGGLYLDEVTNLTISNAAIKRNYARYFGGGLYGSRSSVKLENVVFNDNESGQFGGGMYSMTATATQIDDCVFDNNKAANNGGAVYLQSGVEIISRTEFINNQAKKGGAISSNNSSPEIKDCVFDNNSAHDRSGDQNNGQGGAVYLQNGQSSIISTVFTNNESGYGGAIAISNNALVIDRVLIENNIAEAGGGGIYTNEGTNHPLIVNTVITGNEAFWGGGICSFSSQAVLTNVTISGNRAQFGSAVHNSRNGHPKLRNSIIWGNTGLQHSNAIYNPNTEGETNTATIAYTLLQNSGGSGENWDESMGEDGGNNIDADPRFTDADNNDFRLMQLSPARNTGNNEYYDSSATPSLENYKLDLDGKTRFYNNGIVDLGAFEAEWNIWLTLEDKTVNYNGQQHEIDSVYIQEFTGAVPVEKGEKSWIEYYYFDEVGQALTELPSDPGIYKVMAKFPGQSGYEAIESDTVLLTITKAPVSLTLQEGNVTYTGEQLYISPAKLTGNIGEVPPVTYKYVKDDNVTDHALDAGKYLVTAYFAGDDNHDVAESSEVEFEVEKAQPVINITVNSMSYTGDPIQINEPALSGSTTVSTLLSGLKYSFVNDAGTYGPTPDAPSDADNYTLTVSTNGDDNHKAAQTTAQFTIGINTPQLSLASRRVIYNGQPVVVDDAAINPAEARHLEIYYRYAGTLKDGTIYPVTENAPVDAGDYTVTAATDGDNNFTPVSISALLEIARKEASITMENKSSPFTGSPISIDTPVTDPADAVLTITYEGTAGTVYEKSTVPPILGGNYLVTAVFDGDNNHNPKTAAANLIIANAGAPALSLNSKTVTYNGSPQSVDNVQISPDAAQYLEVTYLYSNATYGPTETPPTDAGVYLVTASTPADENFTAGTITATLTVEKADQIIYFPEIPIKQTGDAPFNPGVTVNTNLPLTYHSGNPSIASVADDGTITVHRSGSVTITAMQAGNQNYNEAFETRLLNIVGNYTEISGLTVNGIPVTVSENMYFDLGCGIETEFVVDIETDENAVVDLGNTFTVLVEKPMLKVVQFTVMSPDLVQRKTYTLTIEKRFVFDAIVKTRWNNTMTVINNPQNNGGYNFTSYKWFRNGEQIGEGQSWSAGSNGEQLNENDLYYVEVTSPNFEGTLRTCESNPELRSNTVTVSPNPVRSGDLLNLNVDVDDDLLEGATLDIYTMNGVLVSTVKVTGKIMKVELPYVSGLYHLKLKGSEGFSHEMKIIVH